MKKIYMHESYKHMQKLAGIKIGITENKNNDLKENMLFDLLGQIGGGVLDRFKEWIARELLLALDISPEGFLASVLIDAIGNLEAGELWDIIAGDEKGERCPVLAKEILEALEENLIERLPELLGLQPEGQITKTIQESLVNFMIKDKELNLKLSDALCNLDFENVVKQFKLSEQKNNIK